MGVKLGDIVKGKEVELQSLTGKIIALKTPCITDEFVPSSKPKARESNKETINKRL